MIERQPVMQFFGDQEHRFHLSPDMVMELERRTGSGIGAIYRRFIAADFGFADLVEVIRLGLIGGGMEPKEAASLVTTYAERVAVAGLYAIALPVIDALMSGAVQPVAKSPRRRNRA